MFFIDPLKLTLRDRGPAVLNIALNMGQNGLVAPQTRARLIIYDYDMYREFNLAQLEADPTQQANLEQGIALFTGREGGGPGTPTRLLRLPLPLRNPTPAAGNGILAVADLILQRVNTAAEIESAGRHAGSGEIWYVNQLLGNVVQTPNNIVFPIGIRMLVKSDEKGVLGQGSIKKDVIGTFGIAKADFLDLEPKRLLAMRLISTQNQSQSFLDGTIILSSFNRLEHVGNNSAPGFRGRAVHLNIATAQELLKQPGRPTGPAQATTPSSRQANRDLTGMYELEVQAPSIDPTADSYVAPAALFLSQSGQSLVGWYLPYAAIGLDKRFTGAAAGLVPLTTRACLLSLKSSKFPLSAPIYWCADAAVDPAVRIDPDTLLNTKEFSDAKGDVMLMMGNLDVVNPSAGSLSVRVTFREKLPTSDVPGEGEVATGSPPRVALFRRRRLGAKMAWTVLNQVRGDAFVPQDKIDAMIRTSVEPLPRGFWSAVGVQLTSQPIQQQIGQFSANRSNALVVQGVFDAMESNIFTVVNFFPNQAYRDEALNCVQTQIKVLQIADDSGFVQTLEKWLADIGSTHLALQKDIAEKGRKAKNQPPMTDAETAAFKEAIGAGSPLLRDMGVLGGDEFEYEFDFSSQSVGAKVIIGLQIGGFLCKVTRKSLNAANQALDYSLNFIGVFGGVSHALGVDIEIGKGDGSPVSCKIQSFQRIEQSDWLSLPPADFTVAAVGGPEGGFENPFMDAKGFVFTSALFTVTVKGNSGQPPIKLSTVVEDAFNLNISPAEASDLRDRFRKGKLVDVAAELYSITESLGYFVLVSSLKGQAPPDPNFPVIPEQVNPFNQTVNAKLMGFEQGQSVIGEREVLALERRLGVYRYLLEHPCTYGCVGFASPEFKEPRGKGSASEANRVLSDDRAKAVDLLLKACLGDPDGGVISKQGEHRQPFGAGREPSLKPLEENGGELLDPSVKGNDPATVNDQMNREYPKWRRVDVVINALLAARIFAK